MVVFADRVDAGRQLAQRLSYLRGQDVVVFGLPRGGVPVAAEVAEALGAPLDVIVVRKLGLPMQPEVAMGAIGEGDTRVLDENIMSLARVSREQLESVETHERATLDARVASLLAGRERPTLKGRIALIVDDGIATGATARVACEVARRRGAARVIVAAPVAPPDAARGLDGADEVVCLAAPEYFMAVGNHYVDFSQTSDEEVAFLLEAAAKRMRLSRHDDPEPEPADPEQEQEQEPVDLEVEIPAGAVTLPGHLYLPEPGSGVVIFAHGSGSSRHSPRNQFVATRLNEAGIGTLLIDLLTTEEEQDRALVFDIGLLASRLTAATKWLAARPDSSRRSIGYFGASTGAGAALWAAAELGPAIATVVSRGGRPDLAGEKLAAVKSPTLLIVGGADTQVLELNDWAKSQMECETALVTVDGATHLFEEPGTLEEVAEVATEWFRDHLPTSNGKHAKAAAG